MVVTKVLIWILTFFKFNLYRFFACSLTWIFNILRILFCPRGLTYKILPRLIKMLNATSALSKRSVASMSNLSLAVISFTEGGLPEATCSSSIKSYRFSFRPASIAFTNIKLQLCTHNHYVNAFLWATHLLLLSDTLRNLFKGEKKAVGGGGGDTYCIFVQKIQSLHLRRTQRGRLNGTIKDLARVLVRLHNDPARMGFPKYVSRGA